MQFLQVYGNACIWHCFIGFWHCFIGFWHLLSVNVELGLNLAHKKLFKY